MFASPTWNGWTARILAGALAGLSFSWWQSKHAQHRRGPNRVGYDPDIAAGALAFIPDVVEARSGLLRWLTNRQGWSSSRCSRSRG